MYDDTSQRMAAIRDGMPRMWHALYQGALAAGFDKTQAMNLVQTWILSQNRNGIQPREVDGPESDDNI